MQDYGTHNGLRARLGVPAVRTSRKPRATPGFKPVERLKQLLGKLVARSGNVVLPACGHAHYAAQVSSSWLRRGGELVEGEQRRCARAPR